VNGAGDRHAQADRRIREGEAHIARQAAILEEFELAGDERAAEQAGETLVLMRVNLGLALLLLGIEAMGADDGAERQRSPPAAGGYSAADPQRAPPSPEQHGSPSARPEDKRGRVALIG
jgi:hypothetical protein